MRPLSVLAAALAAFGTGAAAQEKPGAELRPDAFEKLHALVKPRPDEWKWARIPWMSDLAEARKKAAAEGKPLYVWTMAGEPLGQC
jgi:hypothetical protein